MRKILFGLIFSTIFSCKTDKKNENINYNEQLEAISVLNFGSIHLSGSTDAASSVTEVNNEEVKADIKKIVD